MAGSFGMMNQTFFQGRTQLLNWINETLDTKFEKIEQCATGAIYCQLIHVIHPEAINLKKVNFKATLDDYVDVGRNWKCVQEALRKKSVSKKICVEKLTQGKFQDNLEFLQWFYQFFQHSNGEAHSRNYNPAHERMKSKGGKIFGSPVTMPKPSRKRRKSRVKRNLRYASISSTYAIQQKRSRWPGNSRSYSRSPETFTPTCSPSPQQFKEEVNEEELEKELQELEDLEKKLKINISELKTERKKLFQILCKAQDWVPKTEFEKELYDLFFNESDLLIEGPLDGSRLLYIPQRYQVERAERTQEEDDINFTLLAPSEKGSPHNISYDNLSIATDSSPKIQHRKQPSCGIIEFPSVNHVPPRKSTNHIQNFGSPPVNFKDNVSPEFSRMLSNESITSTNLPSPVAYGNLTDQQLRQMSLETRVLMDTMEITRAKNIQLLNKIDDMSDTHMSANETQYPVKINPPPPSHESLNSNQNILNEIQNIQQTVTTKPNLLKKETPLVLMKSYNLSEVVESDSIVATSPPSKSPCLLAPVGDIIEL